MIYRKIEKGTVIGWDMYYVVVNTIVKNNKLHLNCICDNANNIYSFTIDEILNTKEPHKWLILSPLMSIKKDGWANDLSEEDEQLFDKINRSIPIDVIAEVLAGEHDDRFDHWYEEEI